MRLKRFFIFVAAACLWAWCAGFPRPAACAPLVPAAVVEALPHDPAAYTQGLVADGVRLFESTGLYGASELREVDPATGRVLRRQKLAPELFGEGLALVAAPSGSELVQLTWKEGVALRYEPESFARRPGFAYAGEGWGLCFDGASLVMSDGSDTLTFRDPATFLPTRRLRVTDGPSGVPWLNELECVDKMVYANVYGLDRIAAIDAETGAVRYWVDLAPLFAPGRRPRGWGVANGIAVVPGADEAAPPERREYYVTGKNWPKLYKVRLKLPGTPGAPTGPEP